MLVRSLITQIYPSFVWIMEGWEVWLKLAMRQHKITSELAQGKHPQMISEACKTDIQEYCSIVSTGEKIQFTCSVVNLIRFTALQDVFGWHCKWQGWVKYMLWTAYIPHSLRFKYTGASDSITWGKCRRFLLWFVDPDLSLWYHERCCRNGYMRHSYKMITKW